MMTKTTGATGIRIGYSLASRPSAKRKPSRVMRTCHHRAPCGNACILNGNWPHCYHTCRNERCQQCHGERFRVRRAK